MRTLFHNVKSWLLRLIIGYILVGSIYFVSGYIYNHLVGKGNVFSPIIGFPLVLLGWPMMLRADIIHRQTLGLKFYSILSLFTLIVVLLFFLWQGITQITQRNNSMTE